MDDDLGIAVRIKKMPALFQLTPQLKEVIDLPVEHHPDGAVFVVNGLRAAGEIDDAQAPHAQPGRAAGIYSLVIWAAMDDRVAHPAHVGRIDAIARPSDNSRYPAHRSISFSSRAFETFTA